MTTSSCKSEEFQESPSFDYDWLLLTKSCHVLDGKSAGADHSLLSVGWESVDSLRTETSLASWRNSLILWAGVPGQSVFIDTGVNVSSSPSLFVLVQGK